LQPGGSCGNNPAEVFAESFSFAVFLREFLRQKPGENLAKTSVGFCQT
jgi:hypothetical protein